MSASDLHHDLGNPALVSVIREEIAAAGGCITFARFMELALYHPSYGYYLVPERRPGRGGDFLTAPELHPFFGFALARQVADCWERLDRPELFVVREYGAGVGGLAYDLIAGLTEERPEIAETMHYQLLEPNPYRRSQALAAMVEVGLADRVSVAHPDTALDHEPITGVILANEVADALPVHRLIVRNGAFREAYVSWHDDPLRFSEIERDPSDPALGQALWDDLAAHGIQLQDGDRIDVSPAAARWFVDVAHGLGRGYTVLIDYGCAAAELYRDHRLIGTLRAYSGHTVTDDPFKRIGQQDLTAHVDFTALERAGEGVGLVPAGLTTQGAFLASLGLGDFLVRMQQAPETDPATYYRAQSAVFRLIDPGGMGRFRVLMMARNAPVEPLLRGFREAPPDF
jgi:SAM-dependent MidA family methyltransferase